MIHPSHCRQSSVTLPPVVREFSTREVSEVTGLSPDRVRRWARVGLVRPVKDPGGHWHYSFQDLAALRAAGKMLDADVSAKRVMRTLRKLNEQLPEGRPLSAVKIVVDGQRVIVRDRLAAWEPESGQGALDFDVRVLSARVAPRLARAGKRDRGRSDASADELYQAALDLELQGCGDEARDAYRKVLTLDPNLVAARVNLGRLLHAAGQLDEAEQLYWAAFKQSPGNVVAAFNLGVVLEDQGKFEAAEEAYRRTLELDKDYADAHYNLSRLLEKQGDTRGALRHLSRFRRLMQNS